MDSAFQSPALQRFSETLPGYARKGLRIGTRKWTRSPLALPEYGVQAFHKAKLEKVCTLLTLFSVLVSHPHALRY